MYCKIIIKKVGRKLTFLFMISIPLNFAQMHTFYNYKDNAFFPQDISFKCIKSLRYFAKHISHCNIWEALSPKNEASIRVMNNWICNLIWQLQTLRHSPLVIYCNAKSKLVIQFWFVFLFGGLWVFFFFFFSSKFVCKFYQVFLSTFSNQESSMATNQKYYKHIAVYIWTYTQKSYT